MNPEPLSTILPRVMKKLKLTAWEPKEWDEQRAVMDWAHLHEHRYPPLRLLHASLNGAAMKSPKQAMMMKLAGMKNGVPDLCLPWPSGHWHGLYIEVKRKSEKAKPDGGVSHDQQWWIQQLRQGGFSAFVAYGAQEAEAIITSYLGLNL